VVLCGCGCVVCYYKCNQSPVQRMDFQSHQAINKHQASYQRESEVSSQVQSQSRPGQASPLVLMQCQPIQSLASSTALHLCPHGTPEKTRHQTSSGLTCEESWIPFPAPPIKKKKRSWSRLIVETVSGAGRWTRHSGVWAPDLR